MIVNGPVKVCLLCVGLVAEADGGSGSQFCAGCQRIMEDNQTTFVPRPDQQAAIKFMIARGAAALFADPGKGKTGTTLTVFKILRALKMVNRIVVVAPLSVANEVWPEEIEKFHFPFSIEVLHGPKKAAKLAKRPDIIAVNPEGLPWLMQQNLEGYDMLVVDESTKFKHMDSGRSRVIHKLLPRFKRRYILTGTPTPNWLIDIFGQIYLLDYGEALGSAPSQRDKPGRRQGGYITSFKSKFFQSSHPEDAEEGADVAGHARDRGYTQYELRPGGEEMIYEALKPLVYRLENLNSDLPDPINVRVRIPLPPKLRVEYEKLEREFMLKVDGLSAIEAANAAVLGNKLRQFCNGGVYYFEEKVTAEGRVTRERKVHEIHTLKNDAVMEIVESLQGSPCLIAYEYGHDLDRLRKIFPFAPHVGGGCKPEVLHDLKLMWNAGQLPVLLVQADAIAHGLNLQYGPGHHLIMYSTLWNWETLDQLRRRLWRDGQKNQVIIHWLTIKNSKEERVYKVVGLKDMTQQKLLDALRSEGDDPLTEAA